MPISIGVGFGVTYPLHLPGGEFDPSSVSGYWIDYDAELGVTPNGDFLAEWESQGAFVHTQAQITASKQPAINTADSDFNGHDSIEFDGISTETTGGNFSTGDDVQPHTIFFVYNTISFTHGDTLFSGTKAFDRHDLAQLTSSGSKSQMFAGSGILTPDGVDIGVTHVVRLIFNGASSSMTFDGGVASVSGDAGSQDWGGIILGAKNTGGGQWGNFKMARFIAYQAVVSDDDSNDIGNALAAKYGTTWTNI